MADYKAYYETSSKRYGEFDYIDEQDKIRDIINLNFVEPFESNDLTKIG